MMKLGMNIILFAAFIPAYANPVDCDVENDSCIWSVQGFVWISDNELNSTDGRNNIMHMKERNFLDGLCSWQKKESNVPAKVNNTVMEFKSTKVQSVLTSGFDICPRETCLSFKYQMKDFKRECIFIEVYSYDKIFWSLVWSSHSQHTLQGWNEINVTINVDKRSLIAIRFQHGNCFNVTYYISIISLKYQSCTESTTTYRTSPSAVHPTNSSKHTTTSIITTKNCITTIFKLSSADLASSTAVTPVNTSSHYAKGISDEVIIGIVIGGLAFPIAVLLIATYLYRRRATSPNANVSKHSTVSIVTFSGETRPKTDNGDTSHSTERLNRTSKTVPNNAQAEYSTLLKTYPRQSKTQQRGITGTRTIYPYHIHWLNDENNVTDLVQTKNQYHQSADNNGNNSYDTVHNTANHTTEFRDDTYDCTTINHKTIPDPIYDHSSFKQTVDNIYDHSKSGALNKDIGYLDHSCATTLQRSMQEVDPTYDHI